LVGGIYLAAFYPDYWSGPEQSNALNCSGIVGNERKSSFIRPGNQLFYETFALISLYDAIAVYTLLKVYAAAP
jgi:hypothetical protein